MSPGRRASCALLAGALGVFAGAAAGDRPRVFVTWAGAEADKGASAWYIARRISPGATLRVVPSGTADLGTGVPFDTPQSKYRRTHNASAFESLLLDYPSADPIVRRLAQLMHDIEINMWRPKAHAESRVLEAQVATIAARYPDKSIPLPCFIEYFDHVYVWLKSGNTDVPPTIPSACLPETQG